MVVFNAGVFLIGVSVANPTLAVIQKMKICICFYMVCAYTFCPNYARCNISALRVGSCSCVATQSCSSMSRDKTVNATGTWIKRWGGEIIKMSATACPNYIWCLLDPWLNLVGDAFRHECSSTTMFFMHGWKCVYHNQQTPAIWSPVYTTIAFRVASKHKAKCQLIPLCYGCVQWLESTCYFWCWCCRDDTHALCECWLVCCLSDLVTST